MAAAKTSEVGLANFQAHMNVPRGTLSRLEIYHELLLKWNQSINLVAKSTVSDIWTRHFLDSAQIALHLGDTDTNKVWMDIGAGAGFPGLVLAIMGVGHVHLIESDRRKTSFLQQVAIATSAPVTVHRQRVEDCEPIGADFVTARACAPLAQLMDWAAPHVSKDTQYWFLKGKTAVDELTEAQASWTLQVGINKSITASDGALLHITSAQRR